MTKPAALILAPLPQQMESPASWISRVALSQGCTVRELMSLMALDSQSDPDMSMSTSDLSHVKQLTGLRPHDFWLAQRTFGGLAELELPVREFLLYGALGRPRYRYCPRCLKDQRTPHFPVHWRFAGFKYCMVHHCMLEEACQRCNQQIVLPTNQLTAGLKKQGIAYLKLCMYCEADLSKAEALSTAIMTSLLTQWEQALMRNGIATLAALYRRQLTLSESSEEKPVSHLRSLNRKRVIPNAPALLTPDVIRARWRRRTTERKEDRDRECIAATPAQDMELSQQ